MSHPTMGAYNATSSTMGAYPTHGAAAAAWMDSVMTEDEWWSWRRRLYYNRQEPNPRK